MSDHKSLYPNGGGHDAAKNAGLWQRNHNPNYTPPQPPQESWAEYQRRIAAQKTGY